MICIKCNSEYLEEANFCPKCGYPFKQLNQTDTSIQSNDNKIQVKNGRTRIFRWVGYYFFSSLVFILLFTYFPQFRDPLHLFSSSTDSTIPNIEMKIVNNDIDQTGTIRMRIQNNTEKMINITPDKILLYLDNGSFAHPDSSMEVKNIPAHYYLEFTYSFVMPRLDSGIKATKLIFQPPGEKEIDINLK